MPSLLAFDWLGTCPNFLAWDRSFGAFVDVEFRGSRQRTWSCRTPYRKSNYLRTPCSRCPWLSACKRRMAFQEGNHVGKVLGCCLNAVATNRLQDTLNHLACYSDYTNWPIAGGKISAVFLKNRCNSRLIPIFENIPLWAHSWKCGVGEVVVVSVVFFEYQDEFSRNQWSNKGLDFGRFVKLHSLEQLSSSLWLLRS